ncbi:MAG: hypothetical protein AAF598_22085, partial [Bacteroidota bacterium]
EAIKPDLVDGLHENVESVILNDFLFEVKDQEMIENVASTFNFFFDEVSQVTAQYSEERKVYYYAFIGKKDNTPTAHAFVATKGEVTGAYLNVLSMASYNPNECLQGFLPNPRCPNVCSPACEFTIDCFSQICDYGPQCNC